MTFPAGYSILLHGSLCIKQGTALKASQRNGRSLETVEQSSCQGAGRESRIREADIYSYSAQEVACKSTAGDAVEGLVHGILQE
jgi:hypothetical protein